MSLKFIPPKEEAQQFPRYASYGAGQLKTHRTLSGARNSLNNRTAPYGWSWHDDAKWKQGFILENVDGEWYTLYHVEEGSTRNELPWMYKRWVHKQYHWKYYTEPTNTNDYMVEYYSRPMTTDEYVQWRLAVERERLGI
jgi:hypothetical protein